MRRLLYPKNVENAALDAWMIRVRKPATYSAMAMGTTGHTHRITRTPHLLRCKAGLATAKASRPLRTFKLRKRYRIMRCYLPPVNPDIFSFTVRFLGSLKFLILVSNSWITI